MVNTPNYGGVLPTVGGDSDTWGTENNTIHTLWDTTIKGVSDAQADDATDITALGVRVTAVEGQIQVGHAGWSSGRFYFPSTEEGFEEELIVLPDTALYGMPFSHLGTFNQLVFAGSSPSRTWDFYILDSDENGKPVATPLATASFTGIVSGAQVVALTSITLTRPCWLVVRCVATGGQIYSRGTTGAIPRWDLGAASARPLSTADVPSCIKASSLSGPWTAASLGTHGWAPSVCLTSA